MTTGAVTGLSRPLIGVSLKLYLDPPRTLAWTEAVVDLARRHEATSSGRTELFVLPSLPSLAAVVGVAAGSPVRVGAQDLFWEDRGPFTGGVSGADLRAVGCEFVEVGHAERRRYFGETDVTIRRKLTAAVRNGLTPVLCVGERRSDGPVEAMREVARQLDSALLDAAGTELVIAYEPEWAIGQEESASVDHVAAVVGGIRRWVEQRDTFPKVSVIYGGSAGPGLLASLGDAVDGLFLGRFAHDPEAVAAVLDETMALR